MNIGMDQQGMLPLREMKGMSCQLVQTETKHNDIQEEIDKYKAELLRELRESNWTME